MSDFISREALIKEFEKLAEGKSLIYPCLVNDLITNAPAIGKGEEVAEVTAQWVIDFIGSNFNSMLTHDEQGKELALEDITYSLTVHDLLSSFPYTTPQQPQGQDELVRKAVADALEEAYSVIELYAPNHDVLDKIRALIKRNAEGVE